jgi:hypothetical protein
MQPSMPLPSRFKIEDDDGTIRIRWRWFRLAVLAVLNQLLFCVLLDSFMVIYIMLTIREVLDDGKYSSGICTIPMTVLAVFLTYDTLAKLLNSTILEVSRNRLSIRHGPISSKGNLELQGRQLAQIYGKEVVRSTGPVDSDETTTTYDLMALDREGKEVTLLSELQEKEHVLCFEQLLERRLRIEDAPVEGEVASRTPDA